MSRQSWAFDTPFDRFKQNASRLGDINQNMVGSWPARIKDKGPCASGHPRHRRRANLLEVAGIPAPEYVDGIMQKPIDASGSVPFHKPGSSSSKPLSGLFF